MSVVIEKVVMNHKEYRKLHAEWYDLMSSQVDYSKEIEFFIRAIDASSQPILELGSGTGRILIPLLEQGFDIYGIDTSEDMLNRCRDTCKAKDLKPKIYAQSMVEFEFPQKFGLILLPSGSLSLFTCEDDIHAAFERVMLHLKPGGLFIYEFEPVPAEGSNRNDSNWTGDWLNGPDNLVIAWRQRNKYNPTTHIWERLFIIEKFINGYLVETEANERTGRFFTVEEAVQFGKSAGFIDIRASDWLTKEPPRKDSKVITVQCRKPE